jgi:hypothetical protein
MKKHEKKSENKATLVIRRRVWDKIIYLNSLSSCELAGFGISAKNKPLTIVDFVILKQTVTAATCKLDDMAIADFFEEQVDLGRQPNEFGRIWVHSHPGPFGPNPSLMDEETFQRAFGQCDWAVMLIVSKGGTYYARMSLRKSFNFDVFLKIKIDNNTKKTNQKDKQRWADEYEKLITEEKLTKITYTHQPRFPSQRQHLAAACHLPGHLFLARRY